MIDISVDTAQMKRLKDKMQKYGPYAINEGLAASNEYLNRDAVKDRMYPPRSYEPFVWSSENQRRAYFATNGFGGGIPYTRTNLLKNTGQFKVNERSFYIEYVNGVPYSKWVIHPSYQIIGHKTRGWPLIHNYVQSHAKYITPIFRKAAIAAWEKMDAFMYGGAVGL